MGRRDDQPKAKEKRSAGRPPALKPEHVQLLCELAMADTGMTLEAAGAAVATALRRGGLHHDDPPR